MSEDEDGEALRDSLASLADPVPNPAILTSNDFNHLKFRFFPLISVGVFPLNKDYMTDLLDSISSNANFSI